MAQSGLSCDIEVAWGHISLGVAPWCEEHEILEP